MTRPTRRQNRRHFLNGRTRESLYPFEMHNPYTPHRGDEITVAFVHPAETEPTFMAVFAPDGTPLHDWQIGPLVAQGCSLRMNRMTPREWCASRGREVAAPSWIKLLESWAADPEFADRTPGWWSALPKFKHGLLIDPAEFGEER